MNSRQPLRYLVDSTLGPVRKELFQKMGNSHKKKSEDSDIIEENEDDKVLKSEDIDIINYSTITYNEEEQWN